MSYSEELFSIVQLRWLNCCCNYIIGKGVVIMMEQRNGIAGIKFEEMCTVSLSSSTLLRQLITSEQESVRAIIMGPTCTVFSSLKLNEWKWIQANHSDFLKITDERGKLSFAVELSDDMPGHIDDDIVIFGCKPSQDGYAIITVLFDPEDDEPEKLITSKLSEGIMKLAMVESMAMTAFRRADDKNRVIRTKIIRC